MCFSSVQPVLLTLVKYVKVVPSEDIIFIRIEKHDIT